MNSVTSNAVAAELTNRKKVKAVGINASSDAAGNIATSLLQNSCVPIGFVPNWDPSQLFKWQFGTYGGVIYIICDKFNSIVNGTIYYIEI